MHRNVIEIDAATQRNIDLWLDGNYDEDTKNGIRKLLAENPQEAINAFYTTLSFGTGGLRGLMGIGCNRINHYTVMTATQGLANYIKKQPITNPSVYIGYDSRHQSQELADATARVLAANGIKVYLSKALRPTPLISFGMRLKKCTAGVIITASHNPPQYNGYKVYWSDGGQILPPHDNGILQEINAIKDFNSVNSIFALPHPLVEEVGEEIDNTYLQAIKSLQHYPKDNAKSGSTLKIVYSSLHGTGITLMPQALSSWGFYNLFVVKEQSEPNGDFPTAHSPNPEDREALELGIQTLKAVDGDILIVSDPDADRLAVAVKHQGNIELLNGNQMACLCLDHICKALTQNHSWPARAAFVKTIATTELFQAIAESHQKPCYNVLTGFKYIAGLIHEWEQHADGPQFIFGGEESYGYLLGTFARDKDAIISGALICEVALQAKLQGKTLIDLLHDLYRRYGVYVEKLVSVKFEESKSGKQQMAQRMENYRSNPPSIIANISVKWFDDYQKGTRKIVTTGELQPLKQLKSDMLVFWLVDGSKIVVRPSGTEPKMKLYCGVMDKHNTDITQVQKACETKAKTLLAYFSS